MSQSPRRLPARPSLEQLQKQAKELLRQLRLVQPALLADAQFALACQYGFESWAKLKQHVDATQLSRAEQYQKLARDLVVAYQGDANALQRLNEVYGSSFTTEVLREKVREHLRAISGSVTTAADIALPDAELFVARKSGFENWAKLLESLSEASSQGRGSRPESYRINWKENSIAPGPVLSESDWDTVFAVMKERGISSLNAAGRMTDAALERLSSLDHVTRLDLGGSPQLTDHGLAHLARLPRLQKLDLSGLKGRITDRGLEVLRHLPDLREFQMCWQQNVSDAGMANLAHCDHLEIVNLLGTPAGDGAIAALTGMSKLRRLRTGRGVTDAGIALLHQLPVFKTWHGGDAGYGLMTFDAEPSHLVLDGPFTNAGLSKLAGLDGLFGLTFFWHCPTFTSAGLASLKDLPNLGFVGCQGEHCDDEAMHHIAAIPRLRMLMGQGAVASDAGFEALSRSKTLEYIWGRECPNLTGRGFVALLSMPALRGLAVSCKNVDDAALSTLPKFPALRELMPMDVSDQGFRHVGACEQLEALWCMYCRNTGDIATEYIADLKRLRTYYAGQTLITDRSLEILGRMQSLERVEFSACLGITNSGVAHLASLPRLREITFDGSPGVTRDAVALFPDHVQVNYSV